MAKHPVNDPKNQGAQRFDTSTAAGPADEFSSQVTINPTGVISRVSNNGTQRFQVYGDGRLWVPIQGSTPASPVPGQFWIETVLGIEEFRFVDAGGIIQSLSGGGGSAVVPTITALNVLPTENVIATVNVDTVLVVEWTVSLYQRIAANRFMYRIMASHDGTTGADATVTQMSQVSGIAIGAPAVTLSLGLSGAGVAQVMELKANTNDPNWYAAIVPERMVAG